MDFLPPTASGWDERAVACAVNRSFYTHEDFDNLVGWNSQLRAIGERLGTAGQPSEHQFRAVRRQLTRRQAPFRPRRGGVLIKLRRCPRGRADAVAAENHHVA